MEALWGKNSEASCRVGQIIGNIYEDINIQDQWIQCTKDICSCGSDLFIPKAKNKESIKKLSKTFTNEEKPPYPANSAESNHDFIAMERTHDSSQKQVYWEIGRRCNYSCDYCWPELHNKTDPHKTLQQLIQGTLLIEEKFTKGEKCHYVISGGEPTLNPDFIDWVKFIHSLGHNMSMHSNGSNLPKVYEELIEYTNLNISIHFNFYNKEKVLKVIEAIVKKKLTLTKSGHFEVKIMMPPGLTDQAIAFEKDLLSIPAFKNICTWAIVPIRDCSNGDMIKEGYSASDYELFGDRQA